MSRTGFPISRRTLLRGAGAALALPRLEAADASDGFASTDSGKLPVRMAVLLWQMVCIPICGHRG